MNSLSDKKYRAIISNAPNYISTLLTSGWIRCEVDTEGPAIAWTEWHPETKRFSVHFHESAADMSPGAICTLWRHEIGHIVFNHFGKEFCMPENPHRSMQEGMVVADIQVNTYLHEAARMAEIGTAAIAMMPDLESKDSEHEPKGYIDPDEWLPKIGLNVDEYPYDVIHTYLHDWVDEQNEQNGNGDGNGEGQPQSPSCGGVRGVGEADETSAGVSSAVIAAVSGSTTDEDGNAAESWGTEPGQMRMRPMGEELPSWVHALEDFARSIVEVILDERRKHARPSEIYKSVGVHMPTVRPSWSYKPSQVCFLVDTSGSMLGELKYVSPVIEYLARHNIETRLITGDTYVTFDDVVTSIPNIVGGGGTDITPLFVRAKKYEPESIICFTDGYVPAWPKDDGTPTLWVGCRENPPYGQVA